MMKSTEELMRNLWTETGYFPFHFGWQLVLTYDTDNMPKSSYNKYGTFNDCIMDQKEYKL